MTWVWSGTSRVTTAPAPTTACDSNRQMVQDDGSHANIGRLADGTGSGNVRAGLDGTESADGRVVTDQGPAVDDHVCAQDRMRADDTAGAENGSLATSVFFDTVAAGCTKVVNVNPCCAAC